MIFAVIIVVGLLLDQLSKWLVVQNMPLGGSLELLGPWFKLHYVQNTGAAWSLFAGHTIWLAAVSLLVLALLAVWLFLTPPERRTQRIALSVIMAGALGNVLDRLRLGYVVDFLELPHWPVFNVADMLLCCGVAGLAVCIFFEEKIK